MLETLRAIVVRDLRLSVQMLPLPLPTEPPHMSAEIAETAAILQEIDLATTRSLP